MPRATSRANAVYTLPVTEHHCARFQKRQMLCSVRSAKSVAWISENVAGVSIFFFFPAWLCLSPGGMNSTG